MKQIQAIEYVSTNSVCEKLKIQPSTLRKYASLLDERSSNEFFFTRDESNNRIYTRQDIATLQLLIELKNKPSYTLNAAANEITGFSHSSDTDSAIAINTDKNKYFDELWSLIASQKEHMDIYQKQLEKKDYQIERLEKLVDSLIKDTIENKKNSDNYFEKKTLPISEKQEEKTVRKKSFFEKLFGK